MVEVALSSKTETEKYIMIYEMVLSSGTFKDFTGT